MRRNGLWRARFSRSSSVTTRPAAGRPVEFTNFDEERPAPSRAGSLPRQRSVRYSARPSARTIAPSFADWTIMPCRRSATVGVDLMRQTWSMCRTVRRLCATVFADRIGCFKRCAALFQGLENNFRRHQLCQRSRWNRLIGAL